MAFRCALVAVGLLGSLAVGVPCRATTWQQGTTPEHLAEGLAALRQRTPAQRTVARHLPDRLPVILVDFADAPHSSLVPPDTLQARFFADNASVASFYSRSSYGAFALDGTVTNWLRLPETLAFYANSQGGVGNTYPRNAQRMVEDAIRAADPDIDFALFDNDGPDGIPSSGDDDGYVDGVMVVHAGTGAEYGDPDAILSHNLYTSVPVVTDDGPSVWWYATVSENSSLGTNAHEFGHILGLPDLYQLGGRIGSAGGVGDWSLMGSGSWGGNGVTPTDLDAPSKIELGWIDPIVPTENSSGLRLRAAVDGEAPDVYKVWTYGMPQHEYFVLVNRRRVGQDISLPAAGGMLVYHVDLHRAGNADRDSLRVQLLQADGRRDIELFANNGDEGDPYPGSSASILLDADSNPGTRTRRGEDSQVVIRLSSSPNVEMRFDLQLQARAHLLLLDHVVSEMQGNGDGFPDPGESLALDLRLTNVGAPSTGLTLQASLAPQEGQLDIDRVDLGAVAAADTVQARFTLQVSTTLDDPSAVHLLVESVDAVTPSTQTFAVSIGVGASRGFLACLEPVTSRLTADCSDPAAAWQSRALRGPTTWSAEVVDGEVGLVYRSAASATYPNNADMVLVSPPFNLAPHSSLQVLHEWQTEDLGASWCMDGGFVEVSMDGGPWTALLPEGGAPRRLFADSVGYLAGTPVFGGTATRRWDRFALGDRQGTAQVRFRFVSGDSIRGRGWSIFRVAVTTDDATSSPTPRLQVAIEPNPVQLPGEVRFRIDAARDLAARTTTLRIFDVRGRLVRVLPHAAVPAQTARFRWDGTDRAGGHVPSGIYWAQVQWGTQRAQSKLIVVH
jgi:immune inhibitor A